MTYQDIVNMIAVLDKYATDHDSYEYGLPTYDGCLDKMVGLVCASLNIVLDEDPRISSIMYFTGCSRKAAQDLIDSGEI